MKVLHVISSLSGGGRERRMVQTAKSLKQIADIEQAAIVFHSEEAYQEAIDAGLVVKQIFGGRLARIIKWYVFIKAFKPDIVHLWLDTPTETLSFSFAKNIFHYKYVLGFIADGNPVVGLNARHLGIKYAFKKADSIVSNSMAGLIAKKAPLNKSKVIYNGFDANRFHAIDRQKVRKSLGVGNEMLVVMCASMTKAKDWQSFFSVAQLANSMNLKMSFVCIGGGKLLDYNRAIANSLQLSNLVVLGKRNDVEDILQAADVSMLFTNNEFHAEGVSNAIMESMAAGLPVIATEGGGTGEIIEDKVNGFIIEPKNVNRAIEILKWLMSEPEQANIIGEKAKETIKRKFNFEDKAFEYLNLYKDLML